MTSNRFALSSAVICVLLLSACSSSSLDVSAQGQVNYACALAESASEMLEEDPDWVPDPAPGSDPMLDLLASSAALLGAFTAGGQDVSQELQDAARDTVSGVFQVDSTVLADSLEVIVQECDADSGIEPSGDVSDKGRISFACALIADVKENDGPVDEQWQMKIGPDTPEAQVKAISAGILVGGATGGAQEASSEMADAGGRLYQAISRVDAKMLQEGIDDLNSACDAH